MPKESANHFVPVSKESHASLGKTARRRVTFSKQGKGEGRVRRRGDLAARTMGQETIPGEAPPNEGLADRALQILLRSALSHYEMRF